MGGACLTVGISFILLGVSFWIPVLYIAALVIRSAGGPFLGASEQIMNQKTLDIPGELADRIFSRELVLWFFRIVCLLGFWLIAGVISTKLLMVGGALLMASAVLMEFIVSRHLFVQPVKNPIINLAGT